jgi:hypothetical protein
VPFTHRALLTLGAEYTLELISLLGTTTRDFQIQNIEAWRGPQEDPPPKLRGALVCQPLNGQPIIRQAAWLFTEVGFSINSAECLVWDTQGRVESPAAFHYHRGCFWLRNHALPENMLVCHGTPLRRNDLAPLTAGQTIHIGSHAFIVHLT